jgi:hypothetical protein
LYFEEKHCYDGAPARRRADLTTHKGAFSPGSERLVDLDVVYLVDVRR